jgi:ribosomal protein L20A (L18A)
MKATGLSGVSRWRWVTTTVRDTNAHPASDLVERDFSARHRVQARERLKRIRRALST